MNEVRVIYIDDPGNVATLLLDGACEVSLRDYLLNEGARVEAPGLIAPDTPLCLPSVSGYSGGGRSMIEAYERGEAPAYEAYALTRKGQAELALGASLWFSAIGGIVGTLCLMVMAPAPCSLQ